MAGKKRLFIAGQTYYVLLEGREGSFCFFDPACYRYYLNRLRNALGPYQIQLHAYALLPNEVQLLVTPLTPAAVPRFIKAINKSYAHYYNIRFNHPGALFNARFRSSLVQADQYLLECQKYIENSPVFAGLSRCPGTWEWCSYCTNAFGGHGRLLSPHLEYSRLHRARCNHYQWYRAYIDAPFSEDRLKRLRSLLRSGCPLVNEGFSGRAVRAIRRSVPA
ncbi:MAG: transposase [Pseudohongiellaceae bacterium]